MYTIGQTIALLFATVFYRFRRFGAHNIPAEGPCVIVANHQSHMDPPVIGAAIWNRQLTFVARAGLFKNAFFGWTLRSVNAIPIEEGDRAEIATIKKFIERLKQGEIVIVFPEGTRSTDGSLGEFKAGAALLIKRANCPVVPAAIEGAFDAFPRGQHLPTLLGQRVAIAFGEPIDPVELLADGSDAAMQRLKDEVESLRQSLAQRLNR
jgi:1-acyl-sn-glycerol-3-phosphate acyltransferase